MSKLSDPFARREASRVCQKLITEECDFSQSDQFSSRIESRMIRRVTHQNQEKSIDDFDTYYGSSMNFPSSMNGPASPKSPTTERFNYIY
jgi:hypothetical protein